MSISTKCVKVLLGTLAGSILAVAGCRDTTAPDATSILPCRLAGIGTVFETETLGASGWAVESSRDGQHFVECLVRLGCNYRQRFVSAPR